MTAFSIQKKVYFYPFTLLCLAIYLASCGSDKPSPPKTKTISEKTTKSAKKQPEMPPFLALLVFLVPYLNSNPSIWDQ